MKNHRISHSGFLAFTILLATFGSRLAAVAQIPGTDGGGNSMNAAMEKLFNTNTAFTARVEMRVLDKAGKEVQLVPFGYAFQEGRSRMELDMSQLKSSDMPPAELPALKQLGMDEVIVIRRPDKKETLTIYTKAKSYAEIAMSKEEVAAAAKPYKLETAELGKETLDGHACNKSKVTLAGEKVEGADITVWNATDLKEFPVQMKFNDPEGAVLVKFKDVKLGKPDAKQFEPPAGLTKYDTAEALMDALTKPAAAGAAPKK